MRFHAAADEIDRQAAMRHAVEEALRRARAALVVAIKANVSLGDDFNPSEHAVIKQIDAAIALTKATQGGGP